MRTRTSLPRRRTIVWYLGTGRTLGEYSSILTDVICPLLGPDAWLTFVACSPGRFFAGYEVKSVMVYLIRNFDIKLPDGVKTPELTVFAQHLLPSQTQEILLKKIR